MTHFDWPFEPLSLWNRQNTAGHAAGQAAGHAAVFAKLKQPAEVSNQSCNNITLQGSN